MTARYPELRYFEHCREYCEHREYFKSHLGRRISQSEKGSGTGVGDDMIKLATKTCVRPLVARYE
jgi:hypothetical protein